MKFLWFNFKDITHPDAGGAEIVTHELANRLIGLGHEVHLVVPGYTGASRTQNLNGLQITRLGRSIFHYPVAVMYYLLHLRGKYDVIIEEINTIPYFLNFVKGPEKLYLYYNQLAREIWFYQMFWPLSWIGFWIAEPIYTRILSWFKNTVITISDSSKRDLMRYGFQAKNIQLMTMFKTNQSLASLVPEAKEADFTVLYHSSLRPMKRPQDLIQAFALFAKDKPKVKLWLSGGGDQQDLKKLVGELGIQKQTVFYGRTDESKKLKLMQAASVLCATSLKEGWGIILTEAASMATPSIAYDVDGLRDSAKAHGGWIAAPNPASLAAQLENVYNLFDKEPAKYLQKCQEALEKSRLFTPEQCFADFSRIIGLK